jgi:hypothetical protein
MSARDTTKNAGTVIAVDTNEDGLPIKHVEQARLDEPNQVITLTTCFVVVNGKVDVESEHAASITYFAYIDKKTGKSDTMKTDFWDLDDCSGCIVRDMTDSFQLKKVIVQVVTPGEDIYTNNTFITYENGKLSELFSLMDTREEGVRLRLSGSKLTGLITGRDEVVGNVEDDYPVEIDTSTFDVIKIHPEKQLINWETTATESFRAHRVIGGQVDSSLVAVKAGATVTVDTFYRALGRVRLRLGDSVIVEVKSATAEKKLGHNSAG